MNKTNTKMANISENDILYMLNDTSQLIASENVSQLSTAAAAVQTSNALTDNVEFWNWMGRNLKPFHSSDSMQQYISQGTTKEAWMAKQLQGKGYEWDWMAKQRMMVKNFSNTYDAGDVANRAASDISEKSLLTGNVKEYQMKAYTSNNKPHLTNTPKDMTVVTNAEKTSTVKADGYREVQSFQNKDTIKQATKQRIEQIKDGKAYTAYNLQNVSATMAKAGLIGCVTSIGIESIASYRAWKNGNLTDSEYLKGILAAGGDGAITASATTGIMIPISTAITTAGASTLITIPIAFIIGSAINKIVAPCFGRGQYRQLLSKAKYYQNLESIYGDLTHIMQESSELYCNFIYQMSRQDSIHQKMKSQSSELNRHLETLYHSI